MANPLGLTPEQAQFFGAIQGAVRERASTADIWGQVRNYAERVGVTLPPGMFSAVNSMRSAAASLRLGSERLGRAGADEALDSRFVSRTIYARGPEEALAGTNYHVRFSVTKTVGGETTLERYTMLYEGGLPSSVGELYADLATYTDLLGGQYGVALGEPQDVEIGAW